MTQRGLMTLFLVLWAPTRGYAQETIPAPLRPGNMEAAMFGGFAAGVGRTAGGFGGNFALAATRMVMPYFEVSRFPVLASRSVSQNFDTNVTLPNNQSLTVTGVGSVDQASSFTDVHGGVHFRVPVPSRPTLVPYLSFGGGLLRRSAAEVTYRLVQSNLPPNTSIPQSVLVAALANRTDSFPAQSQFALNFGGGIRFYATERFGLRAEIKGYKPAKEIFFGSSDPFFKMTVGFFYYFR